VQDCLPCLPDGRAAINRAGLGEDGVEPQKVAPDATQKAVLSCSSLALATPAGKLETVSATAWLSDSTTPDLAMETR
jgi:hypothetical protein